MPQDQTNDQTDIAFTPQGTPEILITPRRRAPPLEIPAAGPGGPGNTPNRMPSALLGAVLPDAAITDAPAPLPPPGDGNEADAALVDLSERRRIGSAQGWLAQNLPASSAAAAGAAPQPADTGATEQEPAATGTVEVQQPSAVPPLGDVARGALEAPLQVVGGIRDALQSGMDLATWLHDNDPLQNAIGAPHIKTPQLPNVRQPKTVTGGLVRGVAQFLAGFYTGGKLAEGLGAAKAAAPVAMAMAKGAFADFTAFDGQQQKLSDLVQRYPALQNPVTEFLSSQPGDNEIEGRFKRAAEGLGLGVLTEGLLRAIRFLRDAKRASDSAKAAGVHQAAPAAPAAKPAPAAAANLLGDETAPLTARKAAAPAEGAIDNTHDVVSGANSSKDPNGPVYIDRRIPQFSPTLKDRDGNPANLWKYLAVHERTEAAAMAKGMSYGEAHALVATPAERAAVEADGVSWDGYTKEIDGYLDHIEHEEVKNPPPDTHVDPEAAIGHHRAANKEAALGVPEDVAARGVAGAAADQRAGASGLAGGASTGPYRAANKEAALGVPEDVAARGVAGAAADQRAGASGLAGGASTGPYRAANKEAALGVPEDVAARGVAGAAADQRAGASGLAGGASTGPLTAMTPLGAGEISINFARINSDADVKRVLQDAADAFKGEIETARRGTRTHEQTMAAAYDADAWNDLVNRRAGQAFNAEQTLAARNLWEASGRKLLDVAEQAAADPTPDNLYGFRKMLAVHQTIQREVLGARAEAGRALEAWKIQARGGAERLKAIQALLDQYGGDEVSELLAKQVASLKRQPGALGMVAQMAERSTMAKSFGVIREVYTNSLLWSPTTHIKVAMSNVLNQAYGLIERAAASRWSQSFGSGEVMPGEAAATFMGQRQALGDAWRLTLRSLGSGRSEFGAALTREAPHLADQLRSAGAMKYHDFYFREISADNWKLAHGQWSDQRNWFGNGVDALGALVNFPGRLVAAIHDDFFKMIGYRGEVAARAFRRASDELQRGAIAKEEFADRYAGLINNPPDDIRLAAVDHALFLNFTDKPGEFVQWLNKVESKFGAAPHLGGQLAALSMRMILPFRGTPSRLFWAAIGRSPLAPLARSYHDAVRAGGAPADIARARMALGTMAMMTVTDLALDGHLTGSGPLSEGQRGERQALTRAGWQPYSIRLPIGTGSDGKAGGQRYAYVSYNQLDPFGMHLGMAADLAEMINNSPVLDHDQAEAIAQAAAATAFSFGHNILDKSWMTGVGQVADAFNNPEAESGRFVDQTVGAFVPNNLRWARRQVDPTIRDARGFITALKNRIPGLSAALPPARDYWGRVRSYQSGMGAVYDATMPAPVRIFDPQPIDKEILDNGINMPMPARTLSFGKAPGTSLYLRDHPALYSRFLEIRGQLTPSQMPGPPLRDAGFIDGAKVHELSGAELLWKKYGDVSLLDTLNGMVGGGDPDLSGKYRLGSDGPYGGKAALIRAVTADYTRAAKGALLHESSALAARLAAERPNKAAGTGAR